MVSYYIDKNGQLKKRSGWGDFNSDFKSDTNSELGALFRTLTDENAGYAGFLNNMTDGELGSYLAQYQNSKGDTTYGPQYMEGLLKPLSKVHLGVKGLGWLNGLIGANEQHGYDMDAIFADLNELASLPTAPDQIDYDAIANDAYAQIDAENDEILGMYDDMDNRNNNLYREEMRAGNKMYNKMANQTLGNAYRSNANISNSTASALESSRATALEAGASAGLRLASNVNTMMSLQNKQSQVSLDTSNNLAQQLMNQRQANAGLRAEYNSKYDESQRARAGLLGGTAERKSNLANMNIGKEQTIYDNKMNNYNEAWSSLSSSNAFADSYKNYQVGQSYKNKYGY